MKNSVHNPPMIVRNYDRVVGITLGTGGCAEHDSKLEGFQAIMGLGRTENTPEAVAALEQNGFDPKHKIIGVEKYLVTLKSGHLEQIDAKVENPDETRLRLGNAVSSFYNHKNIAVDYSVCEKPFSSAWAALFNTGNAEIRAFTPEAREALTNVYDAMLAGEALMAGRDYQVFGDRVLDPYKQSPLIVDRRGLTAEQRQAVIDEDIEDLKLERRVRETGIPQALEDAGIEFYAFLPSEQADGSMSFFINPKSPDHNHGWFTGEEIMQMIEGTGPAVKEAPPQSFGR
ncbi:hypothetical protein [Sulfitobacter sp. R18_1]|uniref:hypothetical protein n=1 Tax=Sulfitobacter sp. R18_1 TaxID=2821104 RepID=UPI001AD98E6F|nr:hypothetical protein [Sulfitobacter sp. R18_1]MBO9428259.1 hypothetical protein [Sulfitobacter sp. R18_1]